MEGEEEEGGKQGAAERKKAEGAGTSQGIEGRGLPQEKDDDVLPDESPATEAKEAGAAAAGGCGSQIMASTPAGRCRASSF